MKPTHTKREVDYSKGMKKAHCGICRHYIPGGKCELVIGNIDKAYWCKLFKSLKA